jgi:hypothetical protein
MPENSSYHYEYLRCQVEVTDVKRHTINLHHFLVSILKTAVPFLNLYNCGYSYIGADM